MTWWMKSNLIAFHETTWAEIRQVLPMKGPPKRKRLDSWEWKLKTYYLQKLQLNEILEEMQLQAVTAPSLWTSKGKQKQNYTELIGFVVFFACFGLLDFCSPVAICRLCCIALDRVQLRRGPPRTSQGRVWHGATVQLSQHVTTISMLIMLQLSYILYIPNKSRARIIYVLYGKDGFSRRGGLFVMLTPSPGMHTIGTLLSSLVPLQTLLHCPIQPKIATWRSLLKKMRARKTMQKEKQKLSYAALWSSFSCWSTATSSYT